MMKAFQNIHIRGMIRPLAAIAVLCGSFFANATPAPDVPAYLSAAEAKKPQQPAMSPDHFADPQVKRAYRIANRMPAVVAQQPCYCWCSRMGHHSLLSCYQDEHAAQCSICMKEAFLVDQLSRQGKTPEQIRQAITHGDWREAE